MIAVIDLVTQKSDIPVSEEDIRPFRELLSGVLPDADQNFSETRQKLLEHIQSTHSIADTINFNKSLSKALTSDSDKSDQQSSAFALARIICANPFGVLQEIIAGGRSAAPASAAPASGARGGDNGGEKINFINIITNTVKSKSQTEKADTKKTNPKRNP